MNREQLEKTIIEFMDANTTITLACSIEDHPWAAAVYYARQGFDLVFFSSPGSRHARVFSRNHRAAGAIHGEYSRWQDIKGLQLEGTVDPISSPWALAKAMATYVKRYPFVKKFFSDPESISAQMVAKMAKVALYVFRPESIRYLDNQGGLGNRWRIDLRDGLCVGEPIKE